MKSLMFEDLNFTGFGAKYLIPKEWNNFHYDFFLKFFCHSNLTILICIFKIL